MSSIITITLNPAIDKNYNVDQLVPEHKLRCANPVIDAGGGGINVSKGLKELGAHSLAVYFAGGRNGEHLQEMLENDKLNCHPIFIDGETRESLVIHEQSSGKEFRIVVEGPQIPLEKLDEVVTAVVNANPEYVVCSGSLPKGLPDNTYAHLAKKLKNKNRRIILDTSGEALKLALEEGVFLFKPNLQELSNLSGTPMLEEKDIPSTAQKLISEGRCEVVVVSMSSKGAMLVTKNAHQHFQTPKVEQRSTVGAGDSMVSGMIWALATNKSYEEMTAWGVACGSAATMNEGSKLFNRSDAEELYEWVMKKKQKD